MIRFYDFTISRGTAAPDGFFKPVILINGEFPGPLIEANWGDEIQGKLTCHVSFSNLISNKLLQYLFTTELRHPRKGQLFTGMAYCKGPHPGWMECPVSHNAQLLLAQPLRAYNILGVTTIFTDSYPSYRFIADTYGTSWYHSHYGSQLLDGVYGPLVIYGPSHIHFHEDLGPILIQDCNISLFSESPVQFADHSRFSYPV